MLHTGTPVAERLVEGGLLIFAAVVPVSIAASQIVLAVLVLAWLGLRLRRAAALRRRPGWPEAAVLVLLAGGVLSCLVNRAPGQIVEVFDNHALLLALPALAAIAAERPIIYRRAVVLAVTLAAVVAFYGVWQHFAGVDLLRTRVLEARGGVFIVTGSFNHHLTYGGAVMMALVAALALALSGRGIRVLPSVLIVPLGLALVWSYARSAWLGAFCGLVALVVAGRVVSSRRRVLVVTAGLLGLVGAFVLADPTVRGHLERTAALVREPPPRVRIWQTTWRMLRDHPLGVAPGRFQDLFAEYQVPGSYDSTVHAHSDPLRALTDAGPLGLIAYLLLVPGGALAAYLGHRRRVRRAAPAADSSIGAHRASAERDLLAVALAAGTAFFIAGLLQTYFWDLEDAMHWLLLMAPAAALGVTGRAARG